MLDVADFWEKTCDLIGYPDVNIDGRKITQINAQK